MGEAGTRRIVVVDAQPMFARGLAALLPEVSGGRVEVVATASAAGEAAGLVRRHRPDLALVDLGLGAPGGLRAIAAVRRTEPGVCVAAIAAVELDEQDTAQAIFAGARGVLSKSAEPEGLVVPLLALVEGWAVMPVESLAHLSATAGGYARRPPADLDERDRALWVLLATGRTAGQIARELHVSERTLKRLTAALLRRLQVSSRAEAAALAGRSGLLDRSTAP